MGSSVSTTSNATDNRQAVTDSGFGLSSSGTANNVALSGHIINLGSTQGSQPGGFWWNRGGNNGRASATGGGVSNGSNNASTTSADTNINILDGGAINKAFDFAAFSLSETLGAIIGNSRSAAQAQQNTMDTIGQAITQASTTTQQATQAAGAAMVENQKTLFTFAAVGAAAWWFFFRGKK